MKILVIENSVWKQEQLVDLLKKEKIEFKICEYVNTALRDIRANKESIAGIILDLGLETMPGAHDETPYRGLRILKEMKRLKLDIPFLINSTTELDMVNAEFPCVYAHRTEMDDLDYLGKLYKFSQKKRRTVEILFFFLYKII